MTWYDYWYKRMVPHAQGVWLSGVIGFNRLSLMVGLMSPAEAPKLTELLPKEVLTRKVRGQAGGVRGGGGKGKDGREWEKKGGREGGRKEGSEEKGRGRKGREKSVGPYLWLVW